MENKLSPDEKREALWQGQLSPKDPAGNDLQFQSPEAKKAYRERILRIKDAIEMRRLPDRVPVTVFPSMFPWINAGMTVQEAMYDYGKAAAAFKQFVLDFEPDVHWGAAQVGPGKLFETLDYKLYSWPGHGVAPEHCFQCNEGEYMKADEYDALIQDPSGFFSHVYLPRVFGALGGLPMLPFLPGIQEIYGVAFNFIPFGLPPVQATFQALFEAGAEALKWAGAIGGVNGELATLGFPTLIAGFSKAPFDVIGDTLRGTKGIMLDMYRQPDKLLEAMEALVPLMIKLGVSSVQVTGNPLVFVPLHKGADGFISDEQFKKFYWPTLKQVLLGLIEGGCIPLPAAEGGYSTRLEVVQDLPRGKTVWMIDLTDMARVKETLGRNACLLGNVPSALLNVGTPQDVRGFAKRLIETVGKDGGFILSNGSFFDEAKPENVRAMVETAKEFGAYA
ncbi:MAG TPA: uroporphyrinogen decarboxylase family protein [Anaerolineae bacterium]|nr:uroporphyrinogen decarboxylase family protein [Anaerolineae bacterium]